MVGRAAAGATTQAEVLASCFARAGWPVRAVSASTNRYVRLIDITATLLGRRHEIDVIVLDVYSGRSFVVEDVASWIGRRLGRPVVMILHGGAMPEFACRFPAWSRRVLDRASTLIVPSAFLGRMLQSQGFTFRVIPNVIDLPACPYRHRPTPRPRLFWMRAFHPIYNPEMPLRVLARLKTHCPEATLTMAGPDKGLEGQTRRDARRMGLGEAVSFPGFLDATGKARVGSASDIFLNTSRVDNMPVSILEACAMGLPVVTTAVGGVPDLLEHGQTGLLVEGDDDGAMAGAVERLLTEPGLAGRLSANGRELAERSAWERVRPEWERVFAEVGPLSRRQNGAV